jgi:hypothetical protein
MLEDVPLNLAFDLRSAPQADEVRTVSFLRACLPLP